MGSIYVKDPAPDNSALEMTGMPSLTSGSAFGTSFDEGFYYSPLASSFRQAQQAEEAFGTRMPETGPVDQPIPPLYQERAPDTATPLIPAEEANNRYGIPGELSWSKPVREGEAKLLNQWKRDELKRLNILGRADRGVLPATARLAGGFLGNAVDPVNIALAFVPVVSEARYAALAERLGTTGARFVKGAAEGFVGAAAAEPIVYLQAQSQQADYTAYDSLLNIAFGTVLGGGLHAGFGKLSDWIGRQPIETRETALRGAVAAVVEDRPVAVAEILRASDARLTREQMLGTTAIRRIDEPVAQPVAGEAPQPVVKPGEAAVSLPERPAAQTIDVPPERFQGQPVPTEREIMAAQRASQGVQPLDRVQADNITRLSEGYDQPITPETHAEEAADLIEATNEAHQIAKREGILTDADEAQIAGDPEVEKIAKGRQAGIEAAVSCLTRAA